MVNNSQQPHEVVEMQFWIFELELVSFSFGAFDFINYFLLQVVESLTIGTDIILIRFARLIVYTFLMVPLETALALHHISTPSVQTIAIH